MTDRPEQLTIDEPTAFKALAHPARQRVVLELFSGEILTATEAAELCGMSPSAMSYHLRALQKAGIVERVDSEDGRERPWRSAGRSLWITAEAHAGAPRSSRAYATAWGGELIAGLDRLWEQAVAGDDRGMASRSRIWLTDAEEQELSAAIIALFKKIGPRSRKDHPEGARPRDVYALILPVADDE